MFELEFRIVSYCCPCGIESLEFILDTSCYFLYFVTIGCVTGAIIRKHEISSFGSAEIIFFLLLQHDLLRIFLLSNEFLVCFYMFSVHCSVVLCYVIESLHYGIEVCMGQTACRLGQAKPGKVGPRNKIINGLGCTQRHMGIRLRRAANEIIPKMHT